MPELSKDLIALLGFLAPGFLMAWVFYAFTNFIKPAQFERIVQAVIFTVIVKVIVAIEEFFLVLIGTKWFALGQWSTDVELAAALITAVVLGLIFSVAINRDWLHKLLRRVGGSQRSADLSEWGHIFSTYQQFVVLHLSEDRRIMGWPTVWPSSPESGHFFLTSAAWLGEEADVDLVNDEGIVVSVKDVKFVEFVKKGLKENEQSKT